MATQNKQYRMLDHRQLFTIDLRDLYGSKLDRLAAKSDKQTARISKGIGGITNNAKKAARSIDEIENKIDHLKKRIRFSVDLTEIKQAKKAITALQKERDALDGVGGGGGLLKKIGGGLLVGGLAAVTAAVPAIQKTISTGAKYQKFEAVLSNAIGSRGLGQMAMDKIADFASSTPFQVEELTEGFVKLNNQGFRPTLKNLTSMGDLAASTGKSYDQLVEAVIDAQTGEFERLKEFGIKAKKAGDQVSFTFKGQTTTVKNTSQSIRDYILSLGEAKGVTGAMAKISETTGGGLSNLDDNVDLLWKNLSERFNPEIKAGIGLLNKTVSAIKGWVAVPIERKINSEIDLIRKLQTELTSSNTGEERRKAILSELEQINPKILDGINKERIEYGKLATNIDSVVNGLRKKISLEQIDKDNADVISKYASAQDKANQKFGESISLVAQISPALAQRTDLTLGQKQYQAQQLLKQRIKDGAVTKRTITQYGPGGAVSTSYTDEEILLGRLQGTIRASNAADKIARGLKPRIDEINKTKSVLQNQIDQALGNPFDNGTTGGTGGGTKGGSAGGGKDKTLDSAGLSNISGGTQVKSITIRIENLIREYNSYTATVKEGAKKASDLVIEALLTNLNDVNLLGGND